MTWHYYDYYVEGPSESMHRYLMHPGKGKKIDHINNNKLDNRIANLRIATSAHNSYNRSISNNTNNDYKGVTYLKKQNTFKATIYQDYKEFYLGCYNNEIMAALAYNLKAIELFQEFANLNKLHIKDILYNEYKKQILQTWKKLEDRKKFKGSFLLSSGKYSSAIGYNKKQYSLGHFDSAIEAAVAYNIALTTLVGEEKSKNRLNLIDSRDYDKYKNQISEKVKEIIKKKANSN